jgi:hypothetical protein
MKRILAFVFFLFLFSACEVEKEKITVSYRVSNAYADTEVSYRNSDAQIITELVSFQSAEDVWAYDMELRKGDIVYLAARYEDSASSVRLQILMDGKVFKEGSNNNEPGKYLILSGSIPFN